MKRGKKAEGDSLVVTRDYVKSTYLLAPTIKANLKYLAASQGKEQSDLVREILAEYVRAQGLNPEERPKFVFNG